MIGADRLQLMADRPLPARAKAVLAAEVLATYVDVRRRMRRSSVDHVVADLRAPAGRLPDPPGEHAGLLVGRRLASPVQRVLEPGPWDARCLMRSLVLLAMLARRGIAAQLVIGVRPGDELAAHAWVEWQGWTLLPNLDYPPLTVI